ncbi:MAG: hypothetical protein CK604_07095 [Curvibacter sp. PD_MW3]|nr:MAG: hypothetical protein CK604_07095 [Curvibacter sp. PD_MW3]
MDIQADLSILIPEAVAWATEHEQEIRGRGIALVEHGITMAQRVGVQRPEQVRVLIVPQMPMPATTMKLRQVAETLGFQEMAGLTLGYGIYLVQGRWDNTLLCHELRHVQQYERKGGISSFMGEYLQQVLTHGYYSAPLEVDARAHEHLAR